MRGINAIGNDKKRSCKTYLPRPAGKIGRNRLDCRSISKTDGKQGAERQNEPSAEHVCKCVAFLEGEKIRNANAKKSQKHYREKHVAHHRPKHIEPICCMKGARRIRGARHKKNFGKVRRAASDPMDKNVAYLFLPRLPFEIQSHHVELNIGNAVGDFFHGNFSTADMRIVCEGKNQNFFHYGSILFRQSLMYSSTLWRVSQPSARDLETSIAELLLLPARAGSIEICPPKRFAISRMEYSRVSPKPKSSPSPFSPTNINPATISSTWVKFRFWVPGDTTVKGSLLSIFCRNISMTVPYAPARSPGPYTL